MHTVLYSVPPTLQQATAYPHLHWRLLDTHRQVWVSLVWSLLLSPGSQCTQGSVCARVYFPVLCKFWQSCGGVNGNLLQEGLHHTHVCCTQSPRPCGSPLLTCTSKEMLRHSSISVSVGSLGPGAHKLCLSPLSISGGYGV